MLRKQPFWWGASVALLPGLFGLAAVWLAGVALVNSLWHMVASRDAPEGIVFTLGLLYAIVVGPFLQCFLLGAATQFAWHRRVHRFEQWFSEISWLKKTGLWIAGEAVYLVSCIWLALGMLVYVLTALLASLLWSGPA